LKSLHLRTQFYLNETIDNHFFVNHKHEQAVTRLLDEKLSEMTEFFFLRGYKKAWGEGPFITGDSVVTQSGHILVIQRGGDYCKGKLALPGGFVNKLERVIPATVRELKEETDIDIPVPVLYGSIAKTNFYDHPTRDARGRVITFATHFKLNDRDYLPKVKASDDAQKAYWLSLSDFRKSRQNWFADHYDIVEHILGI
jgi:bifunctional NMN adenylyltransferase/nudix hydrolase